MYKNYLNFFKLTKNLKAILYILFFYIFLCHFLLICGNMRVSALYISMLPLARFVKMEYPGIPDWYTLKYLKTFQIFEIMKLRKLFFFQF